MFFTHKVTARFFEIDRAGIVFFNRFFEYCQVTLEELLTKMYGNLENSWQMGALAMLVVHAEADYKQSIYLGDQLIVALQVAHIGEHSVGLHYTIRGEQDDVLRAELRFTYCFIDKATGKADKVPESWLLKLRELDLY